MSSMTAAEQLNREFLGIRSRLLDVAASLDRVARSEGDLSDDPRLGQIREVLRILAQPGDDRAERLQQSLSLDYDPDWRKKFGL